jgi:hypothetical protein
MTAWKKTLHFGKLAPKLDTRTLQLARYLVPALPAPPAKHDVLAAVYAKLGVSDPTALFPMDGNDQYGDCTIAALAHATTVYFGLVGTKKIMTTAAVEKLYWRLTGGVDSGLNELDVMNFWRKHTEGGDKILAFAEIDRKSHAHVKQAIALFGGVYIGFQVQENAIADFDARRTWTPGTLTQDGHAVYVVGYDSKGVTLLTWGNTQRATWAWWDECVDEAYAILPPQAKEIDFAGFDLAALEADLAALAVKAATGELAKPPEGCVAGFAAPGTVGFTEARTMSHDPPPGFVAGYAVPGIAGFAH